MNESGNGAVFLNYFHCDAREIQGSFLYLAAAHLKILDAFNRCYDNRFRATPGIWTAVSAFIESGKRMNAQYEQTYGITNELHPSEDDARK